MPPQIFTILKVRRAGKKKGGYSPSPQVLKFKDTTGVSVGPVLLEQPSYWRANYCTIAAFLFSAVFCEVALALPCESSPQVFLAFCWTTLNFLCIHLFYKLKLSPMLCKKDCITI